MSKIALITGTSSGIGLSAAVLLAKSGFKVVATMRDLAKSQALRARAEREQAALDVRQLDVVDQASVDACVKAVLAEHGRIDLLVNNAGAGHLGTVEQVPVEAAQRTLDVNFFGVWRVTRAVLPAMREARSGRIVTVSSIGGIVGQPFNDAYCAAKFAVEGMMESLAPVAAQFGVGVALVEPGPVLTEFVANAKANDVGADPYKPYVDAQIRGMQERFASVAQSGDDIARVILEAATAEKPHLRYLTSDLTRALASMKQGDLTGDAVVERFIGTLRPAS